MLQKFHKETLIDVVYLFLLSAFFLFFRLWWGSLASWDEALYAGVAKDMLQLGHWFKLTVGGEPWSDKPPLAMWVTALCFKLFGVGEFAARFFSALCGVGTVLATYFMGRHLFGRWIGFLGAGALISSLHFIRFARFGMMDSPYIFFMTLAFFFFWLGQERNRYLIFSGIALGLAFMTKSFAAFWFFPVIFVYSLLAWDFRSISKSSFWIGIMIATLIALPWNLFEMTVNRTTFTNGVVFKHVILRSFTALDGHTGNAYYYIRTMVNKYHPWILVGILSGPWFLFRAIKKREPEFAFMASWMFVILLIVTLIRTKLPWYILPVYPALSISVGYALARVFDDKQAPFMRVAFFVVMCVHVLLGRIFHQDYSREIKGAVTLVQSAVPEGQTLYLYNKHDGPAANFYFERPTQYLDDQGEFSAAAEKAKGAFYCVVDAGNAAALEPLLPRFKMTVLGRSEELYLIGKK